MNRRQYIVGAGIAGASVLTGTVSGTGSRRQEHGRTESQHGSGIKTGTEIIVGLPPSSNVPTAKIRAIVPNASIERDYRGLRVVTFRLPSNANQNAVIANLKARDDIRYVETNGTLSTEVVPTDTEFENQNGVKVINCESAWDITQGSRDVKIAVLDQGVQHDHPDLAAAMDTQFANGGYDFVDKDDDPYPDDLVEEYHGTHVAGIAVADTDNSEGIAGVSKSTLMAGRVTNEDHIATKTDLVDGIIWATDNGADIINISLGSESYSEVLKDAVSYAHQQGALVVAAAGNSYGGKVRYPAAYSECIAVSALTPSGNTGGYSSIGSEIDIAAPGTGIMSTVNYGGYGRYTGTSMAAPFVSGVAALVLSRWALTNDQLRNHLEKTAVDMGLPGERQGSGRVDAYNAVSTTPDTSTANESEVMIDNFEYSETTLTDNYSINRGASGVGLDQTVAYEGSQSLEINNTDSELVSYQGLNQYPEPGNTISLRINATGGADTVNFLYGAQSGSDSWYFVKMHFPNNNVFLYKEKSGSTTLLSSATTGFTLSEDIWYNLEIEWRADGEHIIRMTDGSGTHILEFAATDSTYTDGGVGFSAYLASGGSVKYDQVKAIGSDAEPSMEVVEDFESGNLQDYNYINSTGWSVSDGAPYEGTYSAFHNSKVGTIYTDTISYQRGETTDTRVYLGEYNGCKSGIEFWFCTSSDGSETYMQFVSAENNKHYIVYENGSEIRYIATETNVDIPANEWLRLEVTTDEQEITGKIYSSSGTLVSSISGTDQTLASGGIGFTDEWQDQDVPVYVDAIRKRTN
uniref:S8 family serine peptidase n=1 Tax=Haloprofundus sp. MHR1 TaxID=2572921 RepID=UPI001F270DB1|nr:S8 family serine peptidase [Haloprofundus sp. MHR1]